MSDEVKGYLRQLRQSLPYVPPIPLDALYSLHKARDYEGLVRLIKKTMNIEVRLRVGWVNRGGPKGAPAWINLPETMPTYGSNAFREMTLTIFFRKSFLEGSTYDQATIAIAHELSHVILDSIGHPLRRVEKAVDLTAMMLGFRLLYQSACYKEQQVGDMTTVHKLGYLSRDEVEAANQALAQDQWGAESKVARSIRSFIAHWRVAFTLIAIGMIALMAGPQACRILEAARPEKAKNLLQRTTPSVPARAAIPAIRGSVGTFSSARQ
jgi:hypothetical protein